MTESIFAQMFVNGLCLGSIFALMAAGLTLVFGIMKVVNFAHGEIYVLGAFAFYHILKVPHMSYFPALVSCMIVIGIVGIFMERVFFRRLRGQELPCLILSLGLLLLIQGSNLLIFGESDKAVVSPFKGVLSFGGVTISAERIMIIIGSGAFFLALYYLIQKTRIGLAIRAVTQDSEVAALQGMDSNIIGNLGFGIGCMLAAGAASLLAPLYVIHPFLGTPVLIKAVVVMVIGGMGSIMGSILAGLLLGFVESFGYHFVGNITEMIGFGALIIILLIRPSGLLGRE